MDVLEKILDLYGEINDIYLNLWNEEINNGVSSKSYQYLVKLLREKTEEENRLFKQLFVSIDYEDAKKLISEDESMIAIRVKDYIKNYETLNVMIEEDDDEEVIEEKNYSIKLAKIVSSCIKNIFLTYFSFYDEFIERNKIPLIKERVLAIKYYNCFMKHDMEDVLLKNDFNVPKVNYNDVYLNAEMLGIDVNTGDEIILDVYLFVIFDMINQLMSFSDEDYKDYNKIAVMTNAMFMLQGCFAFISEGDYYNIKDKIFNRIEELRNDKNNKSISMIYDIISARKQYQSRIRKLTFRSYRD